MNKSNTASRLGGQASFFFLGNVFTLLVGLPLQIYVARMLGADGLGVFSLIEGGVGLVAGFIAFGLAPTLVKFIPAHLERGEHGCIRKLVKHGALTLLTAGGIAFALMLLVMPLATQRWPELADHQTAVIVMGLLIPLSLLAFFLQQGLRGFQEIRYMVVGSSFMQLTVKAILAVLLLTMGFQLMGYVWAVVASVLCGVAWMAVGLRRKVAALPASTEDVCDGTHKKAWLDYAKTMYSGSLLGMGGTYLDRFLLGMFAGAGPVGVLAVLKQLQLMPVVFLNMFLAVASPMFSAAHARDDKAELQHIYHLTTDWVVRLSAPLFIFFFLFAEPLLHLFGPRFAAEGVYPLWIILTGQLVNLAFGPVGNLMWLSGLEKRALKLSVYQMALTSVGLLVGVPMFGLAGAAAAISAGVVFINIAEYLAAKKQINLRWSDRRYLGWSAPAVAACATGLAARLYGPAEAGPVWLVVCLALLYGVFHGISLLQGLHEDDRALLGHLRAKLGISPQAENDIAVKTNGFFLLSCSRSGSTLLASMLNRHPEIVVPSETWWMSTAKAFGRRHISSPLVTRMFLRSIRMNLKQGSDRAILKAFDRMYPRIKGYTGSYDGLFRLFSQEMRNEVSKKVFGEKTPANTTFYPEINRAFPDFKKVVLLRDPRDILRSYIHAWYGEKYSEENLLQAATTIKVYLHNIINNRQKDDLMVRYEELTVNPQREIERICNYLGVENVPELATDFIPTVRPAGLHANMAQAVRKNSGNYAALPERLVETMEFIFQRELDALGYARRFAAPHTDSVLLEKIEGAVKERLARELPSKLSENWRCAMSCYLHHLARAFAQGMGIKKMGWYWR